MPTPRFGLPFIAQGQAQKEVTHNDALIQLDHLGDKEAAFLAMHQFRHCIGLSRGHECLDALQSSNSVSQ